MYHATTKRIFADSNVRSVAFYELENTGGGVKEGQWAIETHTGRQEPAGALGRALPLPNWLASAAKLVPQMFLVHTIRFPTRYPAYSLVHVFRNGCEIPHLLK
jgi:hypothetical protein